MDAPGFTFDVGLYHITRSLPEGGNFASPVKVKYDLLYVVKAFI